MVIRAPLCRIATSLSPLLACVCRVNRNLTFGANPRYRRSIKGESIEKTFPAELEGSNIFARLSSQFNIGGLLGVLFFRRSHVAVRDGRLRFLLMLHSSTVAIKMPTLFYLMLKAYTFLPFLFFRGGRY